MDVNLFKKYYVEPDVVLLSAMLMNYRHKRINESYRALEKSFEQWKRRTLPNNKLKLMGIPMRRKGSS